MKKAWVAGVIVLIGALVLGAFLTQPREPLYDGKSYTHWFRQFYTSGSNGRHDPADREEALFALRKMGTNIYPLLIREYFSPEKGTKFGKLIFQFNTLFKGRDLSYISPEEIHQEAAWAIKKIGPSTQDFLPLLSKDLELTNTNKYRGALFLLGCVGENREQVIAILAKALKDQDARTRTMALQSLSWLGDAADAALPELLELLKKSNKPSHQVVSLLGTIGPAAKEAIPRLEKACEATDKSRFSAAVALYQIDPGNKKALNILTNLDAISPQEMDHLAWAFGQARTFPIQFILPLTDNTNNTGLTRTIAALEKNSPQAATFALMKQLQSDKQNTQLWAAGWLLRIDRNSLIGATFLLDHLRKEKRDRSYDGYAIDQLGEASPTLKIATSDLTRMEKETGNLRLQQTAKRALKRIRIRELMQKEGWKDYAPYQ